MGDSCTEESWCKQQRSRLNARDLRAQNLNWEKMLGKTELGVGRRDVFLTQWQCIAWKAGKPGLWKQTLPCECQYCPSALCHLAFSAQPLSTPSSHWKPRPKEDRWLAQHSTAKKQHSQDSKPEVAASRTFGLDHGIRPPLRYLNQRPLEGKKCSHSPSPKSSLGSSGSPFSY